MRMSLSSAEQDENYSMCITKTVVNYVQYIKICTMFPVFYLSANKCVVIGTTNYVNAVVLLESWWSTH